MDRADRLTVLTYHAVDDRVSVISTAPARFGRQMDMLAERGLAGIGLTQAFDHFEASGRFPDRAVALTFDDGFLSVLQRALPALSAHGFTATVFLSTGLVGLAASAARRRNPDLDRDMLSWQQTAELLRAGFEPGSHTVSHADLTRLEPAARERELADAKAELEQRLQTPVHSLAYPYGRVNRAVRDAAARHYRLACTTRLARHAANRDPLRIDRIDMFYMQDLTRFGRLLDGELSGWLPLRRILRQLKSRAR